MPEGFVGHVVQHLTGQQPDDRQMNGLRNMPGHFLVIASDDLELHATFCEVDDGLLHIGLRGIEEKQKTDKNHFLFIGARIGIGSIVQFPDCDTQHAEAFSAPFAIALFNLD
jgi:hypothetical protein